ncbi:Cytidine_deaminase [Hexamita inflata]|uniref:cytidine deaminase n=1 Tax=Hexamita inflata TaxID=28002 RepID=A0AA86TLV9_9EUKA|nr:Cytidine deaminase [Hexamita inflata]
MDKLSDQNLSCNEPNCFHKRDKLWFCLSCGYIGCSENENKHVNAHFLATSHHHFINIENKQIWCHSCYDFVHVQGTVEFFTENMQQSTNYERWCNSLNNISWKQQLVKAAVEASQMAYCPYSNYKVGAALLVAGTQEAPVIIKGCNVENAAYPSGNCAEKTAISNGVISGYQKFDAVAIVTRDGGLPCGQCRQVLNEFNPVMLVIMCDMDGTIVNEVKLNEILPFAFGPRNLL